MPRCMICLLTCLICKLHACCMHENVEWHMPPMFDVAWPVKHESYDGIFAACNFEHESRYNSRCIQAGGIG